MRAVHVLGFCEGERCNELIVTCFQNDPPTLIAERGRQSSLLRLQPSASGSRCVGRNESLWEHPGQASVV